MLIQGLLICMALSSCIKEEFNADHLDPTLQINPGVAVPIGWANYRMEEILLDTLNPDALVIGDDGFISLVYTQELNSLQASEIISIPDVEPQTISLDNPFGMEIDLNLLPGDTVFYDTLEFILPLSGTSGAEIDSILIRRGLMDISASSRYPGMIWSTRFLFPGVTDWQVYLNDDDEGQPVTASLENITMPLKNDASATNQLCLLVVFTIWSSDVTIGTGPVIDVSIGLRETEYSVIWGYLGQFDIDIGPQSFCVEYFDRLSGGTFHFKDPQMKIRFLNSFGMPIQISMTEFSAVSGGVQTPITGDSVPGPSNPRTLAYPGWGQEGESIADSLVWDRDNTNLFEALETSPDEISVEVNGSTNPEGYTPMNFMLDTSSLSVSTELLLPMDGYADILFIADTLDFVFGDFYDSPPEEILRLIFRLNYITQFPVDISTQMYFYNEGGLLLDSLFHDSGDPKRIVHGASDSDGNGITEPFEPEPVEVELSREQIDNISGCYYVIAQGKVKTTDSNEGKNVRFYSYYIFNTFISAIAELEMNSDDY